MVVGKIYTHARRMPEKTAIIYGDHRTSYHDLACIISATRRYLAALGLPGSGVAVLAIASLLDSCVTGLALRSLGLTTVGVPSADQIGQLGLPNIQCVVTSEIEHWPGLAALCAAAGWRCISIPRAAYADIAADTAPEMSDLADKEGGHIVLTSGTTGNYKKILIDPDLRAIQASIRRNICEISSQSVISVFNCGCWRDLGYHYPLISWEVGATIVFQEVKAENEFESLQRAGVTHAYGTPWRLGQILSASGGALRRDDTLRLFLTGGPLSRTMADEARARLTRRIYTRVAASEVGSLTQTLIEQPEDLRWHRILPSREVQIVDSEDRIRPVGQEGLLRVRIIDGLKGYLHDDETSRAFFRDGCFYTGDLGVIRSDGRLALVGRVTDVVNVLGNKFAPGPIEEAVQREFAISGACIFSMPQANGEEAVHIAIESRQLVDLDRLGALLYTMLPGPFRAAVHLVDPLPRNDMGKVQRNILKQMLGLLS